jgi:carboxylesterase type B
MLQAYPNDPALGCPYNGQDTEYGEGSQYKRMAAIATDGTWTEGWLEIIETLSLRTSTWGLLWEQPIPGAPAALGVTHGSDLIYYFPNLLGAESSPSSSRDTALMHAVQDALINFVSFGDPNAGASGSEESGYHWPLYNESQMITVMNARNVAEAQKPPHRPGFDVIHKFLRPGPF